MTTRRSYFANILFLDEQIGLIINALKENNFINNTFIIFVSDHGDGQGDHYHWRKGYPYEFSSHVPFIIHWPETILSWKRGQIREEVVELRDLFPTFLDIANGTNLIPNDINGSSILDLLRSSSSSSSSSKKDIIDGSDATTTSTSWRQWIDLEHDICYNITNHWNALTDGKMKYIYRAYFGDEQLFNLTNDQYEMNDLSKDNKYIDVLEMWRKRLVQQFVNEQRGVSWVNDEGKLMKRVQGMLYSRYYPKILPEVGGT
jgi:arylsulfatase A-like enzyme